MAATLAPIIVIVGPTASGKSSLAIDIAKEIKGEIICADSRTIYKGMDIGTAKPTIPEQGGIPHHLLDIITLEQTYSAAQFKADANRLISEISDRDKLPIIVGGSGLYINALIFDYQFRPIDEAKRQRMQNLSLEELQAEARACGLDESIVDFKNPRHLMRAIETGIVLHEKQQLRDNTLLIGLKPDREILTSRIKNRVKMMFSQNLVAEVTALGERYGWGVAPLKGIGYKVFAQYARGEITENEAKLKTVQGDLGLAKRQATWFRRNSNIIWFETAEQAFRFTIEQLK